MYKWEGAGVLLLEVHPNDVNNFFRKLIDTSSESCDGDSPPEIPAVAGSGGRARNRVFCSNCPVCEFASV